MNRGDLRIEHASEGGAFTGDFLITGNEVDGMTGGCVALTAADLRWLVTAAGPAMLAQHAPLPTALDATARKAEGCAQPKKSA